MNGYPQACKAMVGAIQDLHQALDLLDEQPDSQLVVGLVCQEWRKFKRARSEVLGLVDV